MRDRLRLVFDVNVIVSALLFENSVPASAFFEGLSHGDILTSHDVTHELADVLRRPKFDRYLLREERELFLERFIRTTLLVDITETIQQCRDPHDDKILELAVNGRADYLVTGDVDLLVLNPFREIRIVTPSEFLSAVQS